MEIDDKILIEQFKNGDNSAFTKLYEKYFPCALIFFKKDPLTASTAEDLAQEIFIKLARAITVSEIFSFKSLFFKSLYNKKKDLIRRKYRRSFPIHSLFQDVSGQFFKDSKEIVFLDSFKENESLNPIEQVQFNELQVIVQGCVDKIKSIKRKTIVALKLEGLKETQIASMMQVNPHTVSSNWGRAKRNLQKCIERSFRSTI